MKKSTLKEEITETTETEADLKEEDPSIIEIRDKEGTSIETEMTTEMKKMEIKMTDPQEETITETTSGIKKIDQTGQTEETSTTIEMTLKVNPLKRKSLEDSKKREERGSL